MSGSHTLLQLLLIGNLYWAFTSIISICSFYLHDNYKRQLLLSSSCKGGTEAKKVKAVQFVILRWVGGPTHASCPWGKLFYSPPSSSSCLNSEMEPWHVSPSGASDAAYGQVTCASGLPSGCWGHERALTNDSPTPTLSTFQKMKRVCHWQCCFFKPPFNQALKELWALQAQPRRKVKIELRGKTNQFGIGPDGLSHSL